jgi:hypothetical protein
MKSIPISSIKKEEMAKAIKEWAEGSAHMEQLLWACFNNGVETNGCHAGADPYLGIKVNDSKDKIKKMICSIQEIDGVQVLIMPDGGNPYGGSDFYKPILTLSCFTPYEKSANDFFDKMKESLTNEKTKEIYEEGLFDSMLDFYDFFAFKESGLVFRSRYESGKYIFAIDSNHSEKNFDYFKKLFEKAGLQKMKKEPEYMNFWDISATTAEEFREKMKVCKDVIINEWSLDLPNEITEDMSFNEKARIKRREFGDSPEGKKNFESWLKDEKGKIMGVKKISPLKNIINKIRGIYFNIQNRVKNIGAKIKDRSKISKETKLSKNNQEIEPLTTEITNEQDSFRNEILSGISLEDQKNNAQSIADQLEKQTQTNIDNSKKIKE